MKSHLISSMMLVWDQNLFSGNNPSVQPPSGADVFLADFGFLRRPTVFFSEMRRFRLSLSIA